MGISRSATLRVAAGSWAVRRWNTRNVSVSSDLLWLQPPSRRPAPHPFSSFTRVVRKASELPDHGRRTFTVAKTVWAV